METKEEKYEKCLDAEPSQETDNETNNATSLKERGKVFKHLNTDCLGCCLLGFPAL
jgi:hypothetical protein